MRYILCAMALFVLSCGPTREDFDDSCYAMCDHDNQCENYYDGGVDCSRYCRGLWSEIKDESTDCHWFTIYWLDCVEGRGHCDFWECDPQYIDFLAECNAVR